MLLWRIILLYRYHKMTSWKKYKIGTSVNQNRKIGASILRYSVPKNVIEDQLERRTCISFRFSSSSIFFSPLTKSAKSKAEEEASELTERNAISKGHEMNLQIKQACPPPPPSPTPNAISPGPSRSNRHWTTRLSTPPMMMPWQADEYGFVPK